MRIGSRKNVLLCETHYRKWHTKGIKLFGKSTLHKFDPNMYNSEPAPKKAQKQPTCCQAKTVGGNQCKVTRNLQTVTHEKVDYFVCKRHNKPSFEPAKEAKGRKTAQLWS